MLDSDDEPEKINKSSINLKINYCSCTECSSPIKLISINEKNNIIGFICTKNDSHGKVISINEYFEKIKENQDNLKEIKDKCEKHLKNNGYMYYCYTCNGHLCKECIRTRIHNHHTRRDIYEIQPKKEELDLISEVIKDYKLKLDKLKNEKVSVHTELKNKLENDKKNENQRINNLIDLNNKKEKLEIKSNYEEYLNKIEEIRLKYIKEIKITKTQYELKQNNIYNKFKLNNKKDYLHHEKKLKFLKANYNKTIKELAYDKRIENLTNIIKLNEIIYNNYNLYNDNYYNSININNLLLSYLNNNYIKDTIMKKVFGEEYNNIIKDINEIYNEEISQKDENNKINPNIIINEIKKIDIENEYKSSFIKNIIDIKELEKIISKDTEYGLINIPNLNINKSYINSAISCLCNCLELTTYFLSGKFKEDKLDNALSNYWLDLLETYWKVNNKKVNPINDILSLLQKEDIKTTAPGGEDHKDFVNNFLSELNADLNKDNYKLIEVEIEDKKKDESELDCAIRFWKNYSEKNNSVITDIFCGLYKSTIHCNNCGFDHIRFLDFNYTLSINIDYLIQFIKNNFIDTKIYYIPKYSIGENFSFGLRVNLKSSLKNVINEIKKFDNMKQRLNKFILINVIESQLVSFVKEDEYLDKQNNIFIFDDEPKEQDGITPFPLYFYLNDVVSAFPRLIFLGNDFTFEQLKRKIYYYARNYFIISIPLKNLNLNPNNDDVYVDKELIKYKEQKEPYKLEDLLRLMDMEYDIIFNKNINMDENERNDNIEELKKNFFKDFPFTIGFKKKFGDKNIPIFNGKNIYKNMKGFDISKDEDFINNLLNKINCDGYCLNLFLNINSKFCKKNIKIDTCANFRQENYKKRKYNLEYLIEYFLSEKGFADAGGYKCNNCMQNVNISKTISFYYLPKILIVNIIRNEKDLNKKAFEFVDSNYENIDMGKYIDGPEKKNSKYDLFALIRINEDKTYSSLCKNINQFLNINGKINEKWLVDDDKSTWFPNSQADSSNIYSLFYRKKN